MHVGDDGGITKQWVVGREGSFNVSQRLGPVEAWRFLQGAQSTRMMLFDVAGKLALPYDTGTAPTDEEPASRHEEDALQK